MLNKLVQFCKAHDLLQKGDQVVCAVSGGADSMALLWGMYLLKDTYDLKLAAAHFDHGLRGEESARDARFVQEFCDRYDIPLYFQKGCVTPGKKGLEAAAREARYTFFETLPGKLATAHTADDNAETVLMHLVRGTGLKGLGGIAPQRGRVIRPMLDITREQVLAFLEEYHISFMTDSTNSADDFLRNRLRHHVLPLLKQENPRFATNTSLMALRLRLEEQALESATVDTDRVSVLRQLSPAMCNRSLRRLLETLGVQEPSSEHISLARDLVFSDNPSACAQFPGNVTLARNYDVLQRSMSEPIPEECILPCPGCVEFGDIQILCTATQERSFGYDRFTVQPQGVVRIRSRQPGDQIRLQGGRKSLKALFIDRKIPAAIRDKIPVVVDDRGILGVYGIGADVSRICDSGIELRFIKIEKRG